MRQQLVRRKIPEDLWTYYLESPEHWELDDAAEGGLQNGIKAILMSPNTVTPCWVEKESMNKFVSLKMKLTTVTQAVAEIKRFTDEEMPDDNQLATEYKQAQKRADKLQTNLQEACNELTALTVIADECFGDEFFSSISAFVEETKKNEKARDKVSDMKSRLSNRGIVTHQTNINSDQVKNQLPIFTGETSLSILDASDTWTTILKNSGIHRQIWGNMILERIKEPALSNIPLTVKREAIYDEICKKLSLVYGGAIEVGQNIMNEHMKTGTIQDPSYYPEAALKVLRGHFECMEHAARFIELSSRSQRRCRDNDRSKLETDPKPSALTLQAGRRQPQYSRNQCFQDERSIYENQRLGW